ncbi:hypothetical protein D3C77_596850 [compost metagenome]
MVLQWQREPFPLGQHLIDTCGPNDSGRRFAVSSASITGHAAGIHQLHQVFNQLDRPRSPQATLGRAEQAQIRQHSSPQAWLHPRELGSQALALIVKEPGF